MIYMTRDAHEEIAKLLLAEDYHTLAAVLRDKSVYILEGEDVVDEAIQEYIFHKLENEFYN